MVQAAYTSHAAAQARSALSAGPLGGHHRITVPPTDRLIFDQIAKAVHIVNTPSAAAFLSLR